MNNLATHAIITQLDIWSRPQNDNVKKAWTESTLFPCGVVSGEVLFFSPFQERVSYRRTQARVVPTSGRGFTTPLTESARSSPTGVALATTTGSRINITVRRRALAVSC